jgi:multicomponent Na+:H+ antiporter subunit G
MAGTVVDVIAVALLGAGLTLATVGLYGMLRMPEVFHQLHAAGLVTGPAVILVLLASVATGETEIVTSAALVVLFVLITSPLSGHAIAQAARIRLQAGKDLDEDDEQSGA